MRGLMLYAVLRADYAGLKIITNNVSDSKSRDDASGIRTSKLSIKIY